MRLEGYGGIAGGGLSGGSVPPPAKPRPFLEDPERSRIRSPFPPLTEEEGAKVLTSRRDKTPRAVTGPRRPAGRRSPSMGDERRMVELFTKDGLTTVQIAPIVGYSRATVQVYLEKAGVYVKGRRPARKGAQR